MTDTTTMPAKAPASVSSDASAITVPTQFIDTRLETYAYRRFGGGAAPPLVCLQHFTGTLDKGRRLCTESPILRLALRRG